MQARRERHQRAREAIRDTVRIPKFGSRRTVVAVAVIVVGLVLVLAVHRSSSGPRLATSCTTPAIGLSSATTGGGRGIDYAITGPAAGTYVIAVDATSVSVHGTAVSVTPPGAVAVAAHQGLSACRASGPLPKLAPGPHQVELFRDGTLAAEAALR